MHNIIHDTRKKVFPEMDEEKANKCQHNSALEWNCKKEGLNEGPQDELGYGRGRRCRQAICFMFRATSGSGSALHLLPLE